MLISVMKMQEERYRKMYVSSKDKSLRQKRDEQAAKVADNVYGKKHMAKRFDAKRARPLIALRRVERGPAGQAVGSIATNPAEVDSIITECWQKVYAGAYLSYL